MPLENGARAAAEQQWKSPAPGPRRRGNAATLLLLLVLRVAALCASAAAAAVVAATGGGGALLGRAPFRLLLAADAIVAVYSALESAAAAWEVATGGTPLPEAVQLWFDFGHDQGFGYMALAAAAVAARDVAAGCGGGGGAACGARGEAAVVLGFAAFAFLAMAALVTGFRVASFLATGSRFAPPTSSCVN